MLSSLEKNKAFAYPEVSYSSKDCVDDDDDEDDEKENPNESKTNAIFQSQIQEVCTEDPSEVGGDIKLLSDNVFIDSYLCEGETSNPSNVTVQKVTFHYYFNVFLSRR